jgi:ketosteroid isomerase-like protein
MRIYSRTALVCLLTLIAASSAWADTRSSIEDTNREFAAAFAAGDAAKLASYYSSDAQVFPPQSEIVSGAENIQALWKSMVDSGARTMTLETLNVTTQGNMAVETGKYTLKDASASEMDHGKYVVVWKKEGGRWKLLRDIWNTSRPAK